MVLGDVHSIFLARRRLLSARVVSRLRISRE